MRHFKVKAGLKILVIISCICLCFIVLSQRYIRGPFSTSCQLTVDLMSTVSQKQEIPDSLYLEDGKKTGTEFNVSGYFSILDHLFMESGYVLDYVYRVCGGDGHPILYARKESKAPYPTYSPYTKAIGRDQAFSRYNYLHHIKTDGTPEAFFQFIVLQIMGEQFYLRWHANYNDTIIICNWSGLKAVLSAGGFKCKKLPSNVQWRAQFINISPIVKISDNSVKVSVATFTKWGGFFRQTFIITKNYPHKILSQTKKLLVKYNCGVKF